MRLVARIRTSRLSRIGSYAIILAALAAGCNGPEKEPPGPEGPRPGEDGAESLSAAREFADSRMARLDQLAVAYEERLLSEPPDLAKTRAYLEEAAAILGDLAGRPPFPRGPERERFMGLCQEGSRDLALRARRPPSEAELDLLALHSYVRPLHEMLERDQAGERLHIMSP